MRCGDVGVSHWKFSSDYFNLLSKERRTRKKRNNPIEELVKGMNWHVTKELQLDIAYDKKV